MAVSKETRYRDYEVNNGQFHSLFYNPKTNDQIINHLQKQLENHSKVLVNRFDIRFPETNSCNIRKTMSRIMEDTKRTLNSKYRKSPNKIDFKYVCKYEKDKDACKEHAHLVTMVNGNACQNGYAIHSVLKDQVKKHFKTDNEGLVHFSGSNGKYGMMINRNSPDFQKQIEDVVYKTSYLAKIRTSEHKPKGSKFSTSSRLK